MKLEDYDYLIGCYLQDAIKTHREIFFVNTSEPKENLTNLFHRCILHVLVEEEKIVELLNFEFNGKMAQ